MDLYPLLHDDDDVTASERALGTQACRCTEEGEAIFAGALLAAELDDDDAVR